MRISNLCRGSVRTMLLSSVAVGALMSARPVYAMDRCDPARDFCIADGSSGSAYAASQAADQSQSQKSTGTASFTSEVVASNIWNGSTSTDWFTKSNWNSGSVSETGRAIISSTTEATAPVIDGRTAKSDYITIGSGNDADLKTGTLTIRNGSWLQLTGSDANSEHNYISGDNPTVNLTGGGSTIHSVDGDLVIGLGSPDNDKSGQGNGHLNILDGAGVWVKGLYGGSSTSAPSTVSVSGKGSILSVGKGWNTKSSADGFVFGSGDTTSSIEISDGGILLGSSNFRTQNAVITVKGSGSRVYILGAVHTLSQHQNAAINVLDKAIFHIRYNEPSYSIGGVTTVDGDGSQFIDNSIAGETIIGQSVNALSSALTVSNYGVFSTNRSLQLGNTTGAYASQKAALNIGSAADVLATAPGYVIALGGIVMTAGATINFNHTGQYSEFLHDGQDYEFKPTIRDYSEHNTGAIHQISGNTILTADSSFTGDVIITGGKLQLGNGGATGSLQTYTFNHIVTGTDATNKGILSVAREAEFIFQKPITGTGSLEIKGPGYVSVNNYNSYSGGTILSGGTLNMGYTFSLGASEGEITFNGGALAIFGGSLDLSLAGIYPEYNLSSRHINWEAGGGRIFIENMSPIRIDQSLGAGGELTKGGWGKLILNGNNLYKGGTNLNGGILSVASDNNLGDISGALNFKRGTLLITEDMLTNRAVLLNVYGGVEVVKSKKATFGGVIADAIRARGHFIKSGDGTLILTADNSYTGGTMVSGGILQLGDGTHDGFVRGEITLNGGSLVVNNSGTTTLSGAISGNGSVTRHGTGARHFPATTPIVAAHI